MSKALKSLLDSRVGMIVYAQPIKPVDRWELAIPKPFLRPGVFHLQQIQPISLARLERKLGSLTPDEFQRIKTALARWLKLTPLT